MEGLIESLDALEEHLVCSICQELCSNSSQFLQCHHSFCSKHNADKLLACIKCGDMSNKKFEKSVSTDEMVLAYNELQAIFTPFKPTLKELITEETSLKIASPKRSARVVRSRINTRSRSPSGKNLELTSQRKSRQSIKQSPLKNEKEISNEYNSNEESCDKALGKMSLRRLRSGDRDLKDINKPSIKVDSSKKVAVDALPEQATDLNKPTSTKKSNKIICQDVNIATKNLRKGSHDTAIELNTLAKEKKDMNELQMPLLVFKKITIVDQITKNEAQQTDTHVNGLNRHIEKRNRKGETPLHSACMICNIKKIEELLLDGANPNTKDFAGWTPLHEAVNSNRLDIVELLLRYNALPDVPGVDNETPLHEAVKNQYKEIAELLVQYGANTHAKNSKGVTPASLVDEELMSSFANIQMSISASRVTNKYISTHLVKAELEIVHFYLSLLNKSTVKIMLNLQKVNPAFKIEKQMSKSTHILVECGVNDVCLLSRDILYASVSGKWIISKEWADSPDVKNLESYSINVLEGTFNGVELSRMNRYKQLPGLFNGCHFYFIGLDSPYEISTTLKVDKSYLVNLVEAAGGIVLKREPRPESIPDKEKVFPYHAKQNSTLSECAHYIIYKNRPSLAYNMKHIKALPLGWLIDCIKRFDLVDP